MLPPKMGLWGNLDMTNALSILGSRAAKTLSFASAFAITSASWNSDGVTGFLGGGASLTAGSLGGPFTGGLAPPLS